MERPLDPTQKAFEINLNDHYYGTFAEIGAGQEVARNFFRAGGAAGTIAKSMSAYDMTVSDDIYGKSGRYVSKKRLETMLSKEFSQLKERLSEQRGKDNCFFVFADTVAAKSYKYKDDCHGWLGVQFQHKPKAEFSRVILHITMLDKANLQQQEAIGIIGTNLIYACFKYSNDREAFTQSLMDHMSTDRVKIDFIDLCGPAFEETDHRIWSLDLVKREYCDAIMFNSKGEICALKDELYKKNIVVCRGSYRPPTLVNIDMLEKGTQAFKETLDEDQREEILILPEISMNKLRERGQVKSEDFLARVDLLAALGQNVLISSFENLGDLNQYLSQWTRGRVALVLGHYNLSEVFQYKRYENKKNGVLGALGDLYGQRTNIFVYPAKEDSDGKILSSKDADLNDNLDLLLDYFRQQNMLIDLPHYESKYLHIWSRVVLKMIQSKEEGWREMVPKLVYQTVKEKCLFDYPCDPE